MSYQSLSWACALVAVVSAQGDVVILEDGGELHGSVIKQDERSLWIDVGPTIVKVDNNDVVDVRWQPPR